jgi:hypothetical protein
MPDICLRGGRQGQDRDDQAVLSSLSLPGLGENEGGSERGRAGHDPHYRRGPLDGFDAELRRATVLGLSTTAEHSTIASCCSSIAALGRMPCRQSRPCIAARPDELIIFKIQSGDRAAFALDSRFPMKNCRRWWVRRDQCSVLWLCFPL